MDNAGLSSELERLRRRIAGDPNLCEARACQGPIVHTMATRVLYEDGTEEWQRPPPKKRPPLCATCPYRHGGEPIRTIVIVRTVKAGNAGDEY